MSIHPVSFRTDALLSPSKDTVANKIYQNSIDIIHSLFPGNEFYAITIIYVLVIILVSYLIYYIMNKCSEKKVNYWIILGIIMIIMFIVYIINYLL